MSRRTTNPRQPRYVYFIRAFDTPYVKIGTSVNPEVRRLELQTGNHCWLTVEGTIKCHSAYTAYKLERALHAQYASCKAGDAGKEWFAIPKETVLKEIEAHALPHGCLLNERIDPLPIPPRQRIRIQKTGN